VAQARRGSSEDFEVWPEHWDAVEVFRSCDTQWTLHLGALGGLFYQGLDYRKVASVARDWFGIEPKKELLAQIRVMEDEARKILNR
jgi:hypothetical protein